MVGIGVRVPLVPRNTTLPKPRRRIPGRAALAGSTAPTTFARKECIQSSARVSASRRSVYGPAAATRTSSSASATSAHNCCRSSGLVTSPHTDRTPLPIAAAALAAVPSVRPCTTTAWPSWWNRDAMARPIPAELAVTKTVKG